MVITTSARLQITNLLKDLYHRQNINKQSTIEYAINRVCLELENRPNSDICVDGQTVNGAEFAVAMLFTGPSSPEVRDGKKYMQYVDEYISILVEANVVRLVKCSVPIIRPNGWGDEEDCIQDPPVYTTATKRDLDGIYEMMYE